MRRPRLGFVLLAALVAIGLAPTSASSAPARRAAPAIAFTANAEEVLVVGLDGRRRLDIDAPEMGIVQDVTWAPDGRRLAYVSAGFPGLPDQIRVHDLRTGRDRALFTLPNVIIFTPRWSPDGRHLAFVSYVPLVTWGLGSEGEYHLNVINADGSGLRVIAAGRTTELSWSPDGSHLAYTNALGLFVAPVDGLPEPSRITPLDLFVSDPAWSPDGRRIAFEAWRLNEEIRIHVIRPDGTGLRAMRALSQCCGDELSWSPDATRIAFSRRGTVHVMWIATGKTRDIGSLAGHASVSPSWSPDGRFIASETSYPPEGILLMRPNGAFHRFVATGVNFFLSSQIAWMPTAR